MTRRPEAAVRAATAQIAARMEMGAGEDGAEGEAAVAPEAVDADGPRPGDRSQPWAPLLACARASGVWGPVAAIEPAISDGG